MDRPADPFSGSGAPKDPVTALGSFANTMHEMYSSFVEAGFTSEQAFSMIQTVIAAAWHQAQQQTKKE